MDAEIGQWSARRRRVNDRVSRAQSFSVVVGHTEDYDDRLSVKEWALSISAQCGRVANGAMLALPNDLKTVPNQLESDVEMLAGMCHAFLESMDRRRG